MAEDDSYTKDGAVDYRDNPAKRIDTGTWKACPYILGMECSERLAYYGLSMNLVVYFKERLNQPNATASKNASNWLGTCYITPLIGAFVADAYLGRYFTIARFSIISVIGMALLTISAFITNPRPTCHARDDCHVTTTQSKVYCFIALYLIALGTGGIKPCVCSFGADQFEDTNEVEKKHKSSFFNWFYFSINIGALFAASVLVWVQTNLGWWWGFGIPAVAMAIAVAFFFSGTRLYRYQKPGGSPLTRLCQVLVASFRKYRVEVPVDAESLYGSAIEDSHKLEHTKDLRFFDKAAVQTEPDHIQGMMDPWRLCTVTQVEELKAVIRLLPVWATGIIFSTVYSQMSTMFVLQGLTMRTRLGKGGFEIPEASLSIFDSLSVLFWVPIYDKLVIPAARKLTSHRNGLTQFQRMGIGLFVSILSMLSAGILELVRLRYVERHDLYEMKKIDMSIFWQVPQYFIIGCAEVFFFVGQLEFFYEQAPDAMKSLCSALQFSAMAIGSYLSTLLVKIVTNISTRRGKLGWIPDNLNCGRLDYFYWLLAGMSTLNLGALVVVAKWYTYKKPTSSMARY